MKVQEEYKHSFFVNSLYFICPFFNNPFLGEGYNVELL